jgi:tRNA synthetases class I (W and Y)
VVHVLPVIRAIHSNAVSQQSQIRPVLSSRVYNRPEFLTYAQYRKRCIFPTLTWIQLGNYFGALANWVKLQDVAAPQDKLFFSIIGWHALTLPQHPKILFEARTTMIALILAAGIDPQRSVIFHQDEASVHTTLLPKTPTDAPE